MQIKNSSKHKIVLGMRRKIEYQHPVMKAFFVFNIQHFLHALNFVGPDHVGLDADWNDGGCIEGIMNVINFYLWLLSDCFKKVVTNKVWQISGGNALLGLQQVQGHTNGLKEKIINW